MELYTCLFVCLQGLRVGGALSLSQARKVNVEPGCSVPDPCSSNPCPVNSYCSDDWDSHSCTCLAGQSAYMNVTFDWLEGHIEMSKLFSHPINVYSAHLKLCLCLCFPAYYSLLAMLLHSSLSTSVSLLFTGYYGANCTDVCSLNPCEHESTCTRKLSTSRGYSCDCPNNYFGYYCEKKYSSHIYVTLCLCVISFIPLSAT